MPSPASSTRPFRDRPFRVHIDATTLTIPTLPGLAVPRSAVGVLASVGGSTFRFVSTHLEPLVAGLPDDSQPQRGKSSS